MKNEGNATHTTRTWRSKLQFHFDQTAMPRIIPELGVTKNEIATKVMHSRNSERAVKVMEGGSTDMQDMLLLCSRYGIDLAQLLLLPNGEHPVIITEAEYERLKAGITEKAIEEEPQKEELKVPEIHIDNTNAAALIGIAKDSTVKIAALYERIVTLTAENASLKAAVGKAEMMAGYVGIRKVADGSELG